MVDRDETISLLEELIRTPSVNPSLDPANGTGEAAIAALARSWLERRGVEAWIEEAKAGRPNVVARVGSGDPVLALCAHLDTVSAADMQIPPFEPAQKDGRVYGRGSYDMKGGAAAVMAAAAALVAASSNPVADDAAVQDTRSSVGIDSSFKSVEPGEIDHSNTPRATGGTVLLALVADEEYASVGAADWVKRHRADACILTEPSDLQLVLAHKGFVWMEIETHGTAAHGSRFDLGRSAVESMAPIVAALHQFDESVLRKRRHELTGPASLHCAEIHGGTSWSTYAESCILHVERRIIPGETADGAVDEIRHLVERIDGDAEVRRIFDRSASTCSDREAVAQAVLEAGRDVLGAPPPVTGVAYWMDAALFTEAGIPTVNIGPSGAGAHAAVEWVDAESVIACADILVAAAGRYFELRR